MENIINSAVHNRFDLEISDGVTGKIKQRVTSYNIVLDQFFTQLIDRQDKLGYIHLGTGIGVPAITDTSMFTFLGAKSAVVVNTVKQYPVSYIRKKIVLSPSDYVGARITEVGFGYDSSSSSAVTHSMLKDSEGKQIAIEKTDTDVLTVYATFYVTIGGATDGVYVLPTVENSEIISAVLEDKYSWLDLTIGMSNKIASSDELAKTALGTIKSITPTADKVNRRWQIPTTRWNYDVANSHMVSAVGCPTIAAWLLPNASIFPQLPLTNISVGIGDGATKVFKCPIPLLVQNSETIRVNGVLQKRGIDYTIDYSNNAAEYPELFVSATPDSMDITGGYQSDNYSYPFLQWGVRKNPSTGVSSDNPIIFDFRVPITVNRLIIPTGTFSPNFSSSGDPNTVVTFDYSTDKINWTSAFTSSALPGQSISADLWFNPAINARYWRLTSSFSIGYGTEICPNIRLGYVTKGLVFTNPPASAAAIEIDCKLDRPIKNENWVLDFGFAVQFERG